MFECFDDLARSIATSSNGRRIVYIPNPGNFGDGLIRAGTKEFFADYGIDHIEINIDYPKGLLALAPLLAKPSEYFFVHGGGGAWCDAYNRARRTVGFMTRFTSNVLVLPSTYEQQPARTRGTYFRRDNFESKSTLPSSTFCHDMAFYLAKRGVPYRARPDGPSANMFRTDKESRFDSTDLTADNMDLSLQGDHMSNCDRMLREVSRYSVVRTDRLHLSIAAALTGCEVQLYSGNYFKIRAIYESSMKTIFGDRIEFIA